MLCDDMNSCTDDICVVGCSHIDNGSADSKPYLAAHDSVCTQYPRVADCVCDINVTKSPFCWCYIISQMLLLVTRMRIAVLCKDVLRRAAESAIV
jgi:hypothetical protein